jgi:hypothetical protein
MDVLTAVNTGLALVMLGYLVAISRALGKYEGASTTRRDACKDRFERIEEDVRENRKKSNGVAKDKVTEDLSDNDRFNRIENDIQVVKAKVIDAKK